MALDRERSKSPMGRAPLPAIAMNVKMCCAKCEEKAKEECEEVEGVVKVVTEQSENKVIVYGVADPSALLKKMRRHLDKHAMYWPMDETNQDQVAPPLFPVDPRELHSQNREGGPPLETGTVLLVNPRDGKPLLDSREVRQVERELKDTEIRERARAPHNVPQETHGHGPEGGPREVVFVPVDAKDGTPVDPRAVRKVEPPAPLRDGRPVAQDVDTQDLLRPVERMELRDKHSRDPNHGAPGLAPREVILIPVDAKDGTPVDPRRVHQVDPHHEHPLHPPRVDAAGRPIIPHPRPGHGQELREMRSVHDPRELGDMPPPVELREVRPVNPRDRRSMDSSELRPVDPRNVMRHGDPREVQRMDPHVMRTSEPLGHHDDLRPIDPRMVKQIDPRNGRPALDPRDMAPQDGRVAAAGYGPSEAHRGGMNAVPEGLVPVRTGREPREVHFTPRRSNLSPTHAPRDMRSRSPRDAEYIATSPRLHAPDYGPRSPRDDTVLPNYGPRSPRDAEYMATSPRQHAPDYGPRSPRDDTVLPNYGPRSPRGYSGRSEYRPQSPISMEPMHYSGSRSPRGRATDYVPGPQRPSAMRPALDRELSFNEFGPGYDVSPEAAAMDHVGHAAGRVVPFPYEPVDPRDAAAFDFHGGSAGGNAPHPRSPRLGSHPGSGPDQPQLVRGYGDIDPRQFRPPAAEPRVLLDVTHELQGGHNMGKRYDDDRNYISDPPMRDRDDAMNYRRGDLEGSPRRTQQHVSQYSEFRKGEADILRDYQPKDSYFSDYHPSQNYQPGPLATQDIDELLVTNPNYKKHLTVGHDQF